MRCLYFFFLGESTTHITCSVILGKPHSTCPSFQTLLCLHVLQCPSCKEYFCSFTRHRHPPCCGYDISIVRRAIFQQQCHIVQQKFLPPAPLSLFWSIIVFVGYTIVSLFYRLWQYPTHFKPSAQSNSWSS